VEEVEGGRGRCWKVGGGGESWWEVQKSIGRKREEEQEVEEGEGRQRKVAGSGGTLRRVEEGGGKWRSSEVEMDNDDDSDNNDIDCKTNMMIVIRTIRKIAINIRNEKVLLYRT
jgi:hypothetical protein